jgi:hypothetical protein
MRFSLALALVALCIGGCGSLLGEPLADPDGGRRDAGVDGGARPDGGMPEDGGFVEEGELVDDGGLGEDGGVEQDAGPPADAGPGACSAPLRDGGTINPGWVGGACAQDGDCAYDGGICLKESEGFPGGLCTMRCTSTCPDRLGAAYPDNTETFCVASPVSRISGGICVSKCDYQKEPLGCRSGYRCETRSRPSDASYLRNACMPGDPICYGQASASCIDYRGAANPLGHPDGCTSELCDVREALYIRNPVAGITYRNSSGNASDMFGACPLAVALGRLGALLREMGVTEVNHYGTYNCRLIAGTTCSLSQHGLGLAIDIASFKRADGSTVSILNDWEPAQSIAIEVRRDNPCRFDYTPATEKGRWLYDLVHRMCDERIWSIILTPNYNAAHDNHLHVDLTAGRSRTYLGHPAAWTTLRQNPGGE